jgi:hypothetical protein
MAARLVQQIGFDFSLLRAVFAERAARLRFRSRYLHARPMHPDRAAVQQMINLPAHGFHKLAGAIQREADQVDDDIRALVEHALTELPARFFRRAVDLDLLHRLPCTVCLVRRALATADVHNVMPGGDEPRHQKRADVSAPANHNNAHVLLLAGSEMLPKVYHQPGLLLSETSLPYRTDE